MFAHRATSGRVEIAFTDRHGGTSGGPYASLNLGEHVGDDLAAVRVNLRRAVAALAGDGVPVASMRQVHGADVALVRSAPEVEPVADALVTDVPGLVLVARVADCVPVVLADEARGLVGVAHAGRPGLVAGVVPAAVAALRGLGAIDLVAWVGPHVCGACYEVPAQMRDEVEAAVPGSASLTSWGTPSVDLGAAVAGQLADAGVAEVVSTGRCTREDEDLYSYRRQGRRSGRFAGLVWVRP